MVAGIKKQGANSGAALSFMIATPESGVDSIAVSWAMLDPIMTVIRPISAFITAVSTGIVQNLFGKETRPDPSMDPAPGCGCESPGPVGIMARPPGLITRLKNGMTYAFGDLLTDILKPFIVGILIAGLITFYFPDDLTAWANSHPLLSMLVMLAAGVPMYVCATSSTPIAAALILKGLNPGAALVFLLAGPATNAATLNVVRSLFNTRALMIYLGMIVICSLAMGAILDQIYGWTGIQASAVVGQAAEIIPDPVRIISVVILTLLIIINGIAMFRSRDSALGNKPVNPNLTPGKA